MHVKFWYRADDKLVATKTNKQTNKQTVLAKLKNVNRQKLIGSTENFSVNSANFVSHSNLSLDRVTTVNFFFNLKKKIAQKNARFGVSLVSENKI